MSLKDLEEKIYKRPDQAEKTEKKESSRPNLLENEENPFAPVYFKAEKEDKSAIWIKEDEEKKAKAKKIKKVALIAGLSLLAVSGLVWGVMLLRQSAFSEERVTVSVSGPERARSGDVVDIVIQYKNDNRASLRDAVLFINYGDNFLPLENLSLEPQGPNAGRYNVGTIKGKSEGKFELQGKFAGVKESLTYINARLEYSSSNFSSKFAAEGKHAIAIASSPLALEITGSQNVFSGGVVTLAVKYQNASQQVFRNLKIKAEFPADFSLSSSEPLAEKSANIWYVGDLEGGQGGEVKISGTQRGSPQEIKQFRFYIGDFGSEDRFVAYSDTQKDVKIVGMPMTIQQTINDKKDAIAVNAGDYLGFRIKFKNTGETALRDLIITEEASSPVIDYAFFRNESGGQEGGLDSSNGVITWKSAGVDKLKLLNPGEEGEILFSLKAKDILPVSGTKDKNFSFLARCRIDSPDMPTLEGANKMISGNEILVKINSKLLVAQEGYYNDQSMANSGPIPPKVGEETTFTIRLKAQNISNDVTDAKIVTTLAPGVEWKNNFLPEGADIEYNSRAGEVTWNLGSLPAGVGVITDPKEIAFQIAVRPSANMAGDYALLTKSVVFTANDAFTGQKLEVRLGGKDTNLREDISVGDAGKVAN